MPRPAPGHPLRRLCHASPCRLVASDLRLGRFAGPAAAALVLQDLARGGFVVHGLAGNRLMVSYAPATPGPGLGALLRAAALLAPLSYVTFQAGRAPGQRVTLAVRPDGAVTLALDGQDVPSPAPGAEDEAAGDARGPGGHGPA